MFDLTPADNVKVALNNAKRYATSMGSIYIATEHLLLGLRATEKCMASKILAKHGVELNKLEKMVRERYSDAKSISRDTMVEFSPKAKSILKGSEEIAYKISAGNIYTEYILYCIIVEQTSIACDILRALGVNQQAMLNDIISLLNTGKLDGENDNKNTKKAKNEKSGENEEEDINAKLPEVLRDMGIDMTERARRGKMDPIIGRDKETHRIIEILCRKTKNNPVLIGEAGVGKSAVVEGLAQAIVKGEVPELLKDKTVFSMEIGSLMAGTKYRGSMEEKLKNAIKEITSKKNIIVFIDEIHMLAQAGSHKDEIGPADILKPYLARGEMQTIGATTTDEYRKFIEKDKALERRFQPIIVDEPSPEDTIKILKGIRDSYEAFHKVKINDDAIDAAVNLSIRYIMDRSLPDKAIDLIDEAASRARVRGSIVPEDIRAIEKQIREYEMQKIEAEKSQEWAWIEQCKEKIKDLQNEHLVRMNAWNASKGNQTGVINKEDIAEIVSSWTGVPVTKLTETEKQKLVTLEDVLHKRVIGQNEAVTAVSKAIRRARAGLKDPKRPIGSFIFLGPTGVGKTELTKALAEAMFDDENAVIRLDMSEYMEQHSVSKMIGSPPGYVGYDEGGQLTEQVRRKPYSVVLFDEIEKAHPDVFNLMLQLLDEGRLTDSQGREVSFKNSIIIMTSNAGVADLPKNTNKLGFNEGGDEKINIKERLMKSLQEKFKPEFLNRVDVVVIFESLKEEEIRQIATLLIAGLNKKLKSQKIQVGFNEKAIKGLVKEGYSPVYGARPLKRVIEQKVEDKLAEALLSGEIQQNSKIEVDYKDGEFSFKTLD